MTILMSFFFGFVLAFVSFFITGTIVGILADIVLGSLQVALLHEIAWTANHFVFYFFSAIISCKIINRIDPKSSVYLTYPAVIPGTALLFFLASFANHQASEVIPRIVWVLAPGVGYYFGLFYGLRPKNKNKSKQEEENSLSE